MAEDNNDGGRRGFKLPNGSYLDLGNTGVAGDGPRFSRLTNPRILASENGLLSQPGGGAPPPPLVYLPRVGPFSDQAVMLASDAPNIDYLDVSATSSRRSSPLVANTINVVGGASWLCDGADVETSAIFLRCNILILDGTLVADGGDGQAGEITSGDCCTVYIHGGNGGSGGSGGGGGAAKHATDYPQGGGYEHPGDDGDVGPAVGELAVGGTGGRGFANAYIDGYAFDTGGLNGDYSGTAPIGGGQASPGGGAGGNCDAASYGNGGPAGAGMILVQANHVSGSGWLLARGGDCVLTPPPGAPFLLPGAGGGVIWVQTRHFTPGISTSVAGGLAEVGCGPGPPGFAGRARIWKINDNDTLTEKTFADTW